MSFNCERDCIGSRDDQLLLWVHLLTHVPVYYYSSTHRKVSPEQHCWALKVRVNGMKCDCVTV